VDSLRTRLIAAYLLATALPLGATIWIGATLLDRSLSYSTTAELDRLSRTLERTGRLLYERERERLRADALAGRLAPTRYTAADTSVWPSDVRAFWASGDSVRFALSGEGGDQLDYLRRDGTGVARYRRDLGLRLQDVSAEFRETRELVGATEAHDLRRGFTLALFVLIGGVWLVSLAPLVYLAHRVSRPMRQLTAGLTDFAMGDWSRRLDPAGGDEVGRAITAFNRMAEQLQRSRDRLVYLTQMSSWQLLARKTAHELKNSLTPIRLTVEEMLARQAESQDRAFMEQAAQIVVSEIETLERRVRAFSEFAAEPPVAPEALDVNAMVAERVALLESAHPDTAYGCRLDDNGPRAWAGADLVKSILMNLLENGAEAAGAGGTVLAVTRAQADAVIVEVHDSGPGLSGEASRTLFEPTITFKKRGMGLGLSIARKHALLCGGDLTLVAGELGGAGFRLVLPPARPPRA
jgi:nitrogen fixation/metabolism regulation signal transduction histidine kinase